MRKILGGFALLLISIITKMSGELLVVIVPSCVALLIAVRGIFQDSLRLRLMGPRLKVHFEMSEPFVGTARIREAAVPSPTRSFLFRVGVANLGKSAAWRVSVLLTGLEKYNEEARRYEVEEWFVPVELAWCHGVGSQLQALNPHSTIYFDLGHYERADFLEIARKISIRRMPRNSFSRRAGSTRGSGATSSPSVSTSCESKWPPRTPNLSKRGSMSARCLDGPITSRTSFAMVTCALRF
jgi:hypothetical protein